jgi:1-deoxy-D-xylulose-5-phosphate reductoisomerase
LNAANEAAVGAFLGGAIGFRDIARVVERTLEMLPRQEIRSLDDVAGHDREAREVASRLFGKRANALAV